MELEPKNNFGIFVSKSLTFDLSMGNTTLTWPVAMPPQGAVHKEFIFHSLVLATIHLRTKFDTSSHIHSTDRKVTVF